VPRARTEPAVAFLASYPAEVAGLAMETRARVLQALPGVTDSVDVPARMLAYACGPGYAGTVCTIIPSQKGVKLGLYRGAGLPDPDGLLAGTGKVHRHVVVRSADAPAGRDRAAAGGRARGMEGATGLTGRREPARPHQG
jgi:hypothetical protein